MILHGPICYGVSAFECRNISNAASNLRLFLVFLAGLAVSCLVVITTPAYADYPPKLIVVVANRLTLEDFDDSSLHNLTYMMHNGAVGLISPNCAGRKSEYSCMATACSGTSCRGGSYMRDFYDYGERTLRGLIAGEAYTRRSGRAATPGSAVFLGLGPALRANSELVKPARLGMLGDVLHEAGKKTLVIGNADADPRCLNRAAAVLAMDSKGFIDLGRLRSSPDFPIPDEADFIVIDFGESTRLDDTKYVMTDKAYATHKAEALRRLDHLLEKLLESTQKRNYSVVMVSFGLPSRLPWDSLTPIVVYSHMGSGVLASPTTRTPGLIAASDFAPTMLWLLDIVAPPEMMGRAARVQPVHDNMAVLRELETRVHTHQKIVDPVIYVIMAVGGLAFVSALVVIGFAWRAPKSLIAPIRIGLIATCASTAAMLLSVLAPAGPIWQLVTIFALSLFIAGASYLFGTSWGRKTGRLALPMLLMFAFCAMAIAVDAATGCRLCKFALPSQFQLSGFRYYGVGNEYAGLLISMPALVAIFSGEKTRKWLAPLLGIAVAVILGAGKMGANYGATLAATITFGLVSLGLIRGRFGLRHIVIVFFFGAVLLAILVMVDYRLAGSGAAHAGRMASLVEKFGSGYVLSLVARKMLLNLRIAVKNEAILAYLVLTPIYAYWAYRVPAELKAGIFRDRHVVAGLKGLIVGMLAALLVNDSGIVMALLMFGMLASFVIYSALDSLGSGKITVNAPEEVSRCPE